MLISTKAAVYPLSALLALAPVTVSAQTTQQNAPAEPVAAGDHATPQTIVGAAAEPTSDQRNQDIVVTGSRISRRDYVSESPIVTVGQAAIATTGSPTIEATLNTLPQLTTSASASANFTGRGGQASADLRGLGQQRTLVLLDGRRMQPSSSDGSIDLNTVPTQLIDSVEVITGGASAVYGSDAVTGVVNLKLRKNVQGVELSAQKGISSYGDGDTTDVNLLVGSRFADDRGHAMIDVSYSTRDAIQFNQRSYLLNQATSASQPEGRINVNAANLPSQAAVNAIFSRYGMAPGAVSRSSTFSFNTDGTLFLQSPVVNYRSPPLENVGVYNNGLTTFAGNYFYLQTPLNRYSAYTKADYDVSENLNVWVQALYTNYNVTAQFAPGVVGSNTSVALNVPVTNPFISGDLSQLLASRPNPNAPFTIVKRLPDNGIHRERYDYDVFQLQGGLSGKLFGDWKWDADGAYGRTTLNQTEINYQSSGAINQLLGAADGGRSLCAGGFNPFGNQPISPACIAYINRTPSSRTTLERGYLDANVTGTLLNLPAGGVKVAAGADYRKDSFSFLPDTGIAAGDIAGYLPIRASSGSTSVKEVYGELLVPVFRDAFFAKELNIDAAYRYSNYDSVGGISTYKVDVDWLVVDGIRLRGGYSRATRAPSVGELFAPQQFNQATLGVLAGGGGDPCDIRSTYRAAGKPNAAAVRTLCLAQGVPAALIDNYTNINANTANVTAGNPALQAETADTFSAGIVLHPKIGNPLFSRINFSVDFYKIKLKGAVGSINNQLATQRCFNGDGSNPTYAASNFACTLIARDPGTGLISLIQNPTFNLGGYDTSGIDFAFDWTFDLDDVGFGKAGRIAFSTTVNKLDEFAIQTLPGGPFVDFAGTLGNTQIDQFADAHPNWKATTSLTYALNPFDLTLRWRFLDRMQNAANVGTTATNPPIEAVSYFDLNANVKVANSFTLSLGVVNLGNRQPPIVNTNVTGQYASDPYTYDLVGRRFFVGVKTKF